ncbi:MAG: DUF4340 domain-containing protein [Myxococcota bacterium]|nr:DUF4340 domain-containing protein [Myxococcota bacterium]
MSFLQTKTKALVVVAIVAMGLNVYTPSGFEPDIAELNSIVALTKDQMTRIELSKAGEKIVLEKDNLMWMVRSPFEDKADQARVMSMILNFRKGISMDVLVDETEQENYGTDATNGIVVEIWGQGTEPDISMTVGFDAGNGSTFVRMSNDPNVYRARIGGRNRYDHQVSEWRNQVLLDFELTDLIRFEVSDGDDKFALIQDADSWRMEPDPGWALDEEMISEMLEALGRMRIGVNSEQQVGSHSHRLSVELQSGEVRELLVGAQDVRQALVQLEGAEKGVLVAARPIRLSTQDRESYRNKQIFSIVPRQELDTLQFIQGGEEILIQQDLAIGMWSVNRPSNIDLDMKSIFFMVNTLSSLRGTRIAEGIQEEPFVSGQINLGFLGGGLSEFFLYDYGEKDEILVRKGDEETYFWISQDDANKIFQGFGRLPLNENME